MAVVYILQGTTTRRCYGGSIIDLTRRLDEHRRGHSPATRGRGPWGLCSQEAFPTLIQARRREAEIKRWKSAARIRELIRSCAG